MYNYITLQQAKRMRTRYDGKKIAEILKKAHVKNIADLDGDEYMIVLEILDGYRTCFDPIETIRQRFGFKTREEVENFFTENQEHFPMNEPASSFDEITVLLINTFSDLFNSRK